MREHKYSIYFLPTGRSRKSIEKSVMLLKDSEAFEYVEKPLTATYPDLQLLNIFKDGTALI